MFYIPHQEEHGLPHDPFKALVAPRPIGWISSVSKDGAVNLAPYSYFNAVCSRPPIVMFSSEGEKDTVSNITETGEFVCNMVSWSLKDRMNATSAPLASDISEFDRAGLTAVPSETVNVPRVKESLAALECVSLSVEQLSDKDGNAVENIMVIGQVTGIHIADSILSSGLVDPERLSLIARAGYRDYVRSDRVFRMTRPTA